MPEGGRINIITPIGKKFTKEEMDEKRGRAERGFGKK